MTRGNVERMHYRRHSQTSFSPVRWAKSYLASRLLSCDRPPHRPEGGKGPYPDLERVVLGILLSGLLDGSARLGLTRHEQRRPI